MPNKIKELKGGFINPFNWVIWLLNTVSYLIQYITREPILIFTLILIFIFFAYHIYCNRFPSEDKYFPYYVLFIMAIVGLSGVHYTLKYQLLKIGNEEQLNQNQVTEKKVEKITGDLKDE